MKAIFINEDEYPYAYWCASGYKSAETRSKRMLHACVGERIALISTRRGKSPMVVGHADVIGESLEEMSKVREQTRVPEESKHDKQFKWCYFLANPEKCIPYALPSSAVRHGRSWCEF